jgi:hypothetical protein
LDILEANVPTVIHVEFEAGLETINLSLHVQYFCIQCLVLILGTHHCTLPQHFCPAAKIGRGRFGNLAVVFFFMVRKTFDISAVIADPTRIQKNHGDPKCRAKAQTIWASKE